MSCTYYFLSYFHLCTCNGVHQFAEFTKVSVHFFSLFVEFGGGKFPKNVQKWRLCFEKRFSELFSSVLSPNAGKYGPEKLRIRPHFTQLLLLFLTHFLKIDWEIFVQNFVRFVFISYENNPQFPFKALFVRAVLF